jgi:acyl carrier protein
MEAVYQEIKKILSKNFFINPLAVKPLKSFRSDLGLNSIEFLEIVYEIEKMFRVNIPDSDLENVRTVEDLAHCVEHQLEPVMA